MSQCSVCGKEIHSEATECSWRCNREASKKFIKTQNKSREKFFKSMNQMISGGATKTPEEIIYEQAQRNQQGEDMVQIVLKHRTRRNWTTTVSDLVVTFDFNGFAKVPDLGNNRVLVDTLIRFSNGLISIVGAENKIETPLPVDEPVQEVDEQVQETKKEEEDTVDIKPKVVEKVEEKPVVEEKKEEELSFITETVKEEKKETPKRKVPGKRGRAKKSKE